MTRETKVYGFINLGWLILAVITIFFFLMLIPDKEAAVPKLIFTEKVDGAPDSSLLKKESKK